MDKAWKKRVVLFLTSQGISLFGSAVVQFAIVWYVTLKTSSGVWVSALTICSFLPQFIISLFAGVWADRYNRKKLLIYSDTAIAVSTFVLILLIPFLQDGKQFLIALLVTATIRSLGAGIQEPAVSAVVAQIVPKEHLMKFNGIKSAIESVVQFVAPATAGVILTFASLKDTLYIDVATAVIGIGILSFIAIPLIPKHNDENRVSFLSDMKAGFGYVRENGILSRVLIIFGLFIFACVPIGFMANLFVSRTYGDSYYYLTFVEVTGFIGMALGGIIIGSSGGFSSRSKTLYVGIFGFGTLGLAMGIVDNFIVYLILMVVLGIVLTMVQTSVTTMLQENSDIQMQGRVFGLMSTIYSGALPLGMAAFGPLSDVVSIRLVMICSAVILLILSLYVFLKRQSFKIARQKSDPS